MKQLFSMLALFFSMYIQAQPAEPMVRVVVTPDRSSWEYKPGEKATLPYYDVVNFARNTTVSGYYTWGFNDETCPPTSMYAAYNAITAPRQLVLYRETGHWTYPVQTEGLRNWLVERFESMKRRAEIFSRFLPEKRLPLQVG